MIYIIGDSHVSVFSGKDNTYDGKNHIQPEFGTQYTIKKGQLVTPMNRFEQIIPYFCPIKIGSNTAYNSYNKLPIIEQVIDEYSINSDDYIFTCFGEIDIRHHIGINAERQNISLLDSIKICVDRYMKTILYIKSIHEKTGVYGSIVSTTAPGYGDVYIRNKITLDFNNYLKERCDENNVIFKSITDRMLLPDGSTNSKYILDTIHLSQEAMPLLIEEFKDIL
jgi:hypothetical protein